MSYGFVYLLRNEWMPDLYKVGCTERSPHSRAEELSRPTGVPAPFKVVAYVEVPNCQLFEGELHEALKHHRVGVSREFFYECLDMALAFMFHTRQKLAFTVVDRRWLEEDQVLYAEHTADPWAPKRASLVVPIQLAVDTERFAQLANEEDPSPPEGATGLSLVAHA